MSPEYTTRPATPEDFEFYRALHHTVYEDLVRPIWGWDEKDQNRRVAESYKPSAVKIIQIQEQGVGFYVVEDRAKEVFLSELCILPPYQNQGIGSAIIKGIIDRANEKNLPLRLHVLRTNDRASLLYKRLGFLEDGEVSEGGYYMKKDPFS